MPQLRLKSGRLVTDVNEIKIILSNIAYSANLQTVAKVTNDFAETIAQEFGVMRGTFIQTMFEYLNEQKGQLNYSYTWGGIKKRHIAKDPKAEFHYDGAPRTGSPSYKTMSTAGTKPMMRHNFIPVLIREGAVRLKQLTRTSGIELV